MRILIFSLSLILLVSFNFEAQAFGGIGRAIGKFFGISESEDKKQEHLSKRRKEICEDKKNKNLKMCEKIRNK